MKSEEVIAWREALIRLSDQHFFDLMRMYLGAIKTPFNKQRLIEELSTFLRKKENRVNIFYYLDEMDFLILSAINELPSPTQPKIIKLFAGTFSFPVMYERILNLEERLLIYRNNDQDSRQYELNPLLKDELLPLLAHTSLVPPESKGEPVHAHLLLDDLSLAALYSFFLHEGEAVKNDGSFRKKTLDSLQSTFSQLFTHPDCLPFLLSAFQNLGLLVKMEGRLVPDPVRWQSFALITPTERIAYLVAATGGRYQRDTLQTRAQLFLDFFSALEPGGRYQQETLSRLTFLLSEQSGRAPAGRMQGRFASIIREKEDGSDLPTKNGGSDYGTISFAYGLLAKIDGLLVQNSAATESSSVSTGTPYLVVSPSLTVTLMPGFPLADLLPLVRCMEVRDIQITGQFEITRKSCAAAFELGETADTLISLIKGKATQNVPQNVLFSIQDWYRSYTSVSLYHGFVLRVDESRRVLFENDEHLASLIRKTLAPGLYLLDADTAEEIQTVFSQANIDFLPSVSTPSPKRDPIPLPPLAQPALFQHQKSAPPPASAIGGTISLQESLMESLAALKIDPDLHDALKSRIERKIVMSAAQLDPDSVRIEKVEARGMDFLGKVRIAEFALSSGSMLEIAFDEKEGNRLILGRPLSTEKRPGDVLLKIETEPDQIIEQVSLGKAILVRRIRGSIFSESSGNRF